MEFSSLQDTNDERDGIWFDKELIERYTDIEVDGDVAFKIARSGNIEHEGRVLNHAVKNRIRKKKKKLSEEEAYELFLDAEGVALCSLLTDWRGIKKDGVEVPYSEEDARVLFQTSSLVRKVVQTCSEAHEEFERRRTEAISGN